MEKTRVKEGKETMFLCSYLFIQQIVPSTSSAFLVLVRQK